MMKRLAFYLLIMLLTAGLAGCGDEKSKPAKTALRKPGVETAKVLPVPVKPETKFEQEVYPYDPKGRRDPFKSLVTFTIKAKKKKGLTPLENFDIEEIKLIAVAWDNQQYYALITLPDNKSYTIREGATLGTYGGKVTKITKDTVHIREKVQDYRGHIKTKDTVMRLRTEGEE